mgnify:CR=1 FL=1
MCIRDSPKLAVASGCNAYAAPLGFIDAVAHKYAGTLPLICLLYTSDAADERSSVDLGGRRIIKKKLTHRVQRDEGHKYDAHHDTHIDTDDNTHQREEQP